MAGVISSPSVTAMSYTSSAVAQAAVSATSSVPTGSSPATW